MAEQKSKNSHLDYAILEYLQQKIETEGDEDTKDQLTAASECLERAFALKTTSFDNSSQYSLYPMNLPEVFENGLGEEGDETFRSKFKVYISKLEARKYFEVEPAEQKARFEKAKLKFKENYAKMNKKQEKEEAKEEAKKEKKIPTEEEKGKAISLKNEGNAKLQKGDFNEAVKLYTEAIELNPNDSIFFCNRAAAHTQLQQNEKAIEDCKTAVELQPNYAKAYSRMGLAYFNLKKYKDSVDSYKKAIELDPGNNQVKHSLETAEQKLREQPQGGAGAGAPDLSAILNNPAFANLAQSLGSSPQGGAADSQAPPPDFSQMMNNPQVQQMMQGLQSGNGDMSQLLNPQILGMAEQAMRNPAMQGMVQNMMQNPEMMNSMMSMLGGAGGGQLPNIPGMPPMPQQPQQPQEQQGEQPVQPEQPAETQEEAGKEE